ncbi:unnamed protein product [Cunninghamella blakesleeana]
MIFRQHISTLTRFTSNTLKYASTNTANLIFSSISVISPEDYPDHEQILEWMTSSQQGMDAFFDDQFDIAFTIFSELATESPFHALGYALLAYVEAMVSFEMSQIQLAQERLSSAENLCRQFAKRARRKYASSSKSSTSTSTSTSTSSESSSTSSFTSAMNWYTKSSTTTNTSSPSSTIKEQQQKQLLTPDIHYELLETCCILMSSTLQFLSHHWMDYVKAAYKLRKTYKKFEQLFEFITGHKAMDYAHYLHQQKHQHNKHHHHHHHHHHQKKRKKSNRKNQHQHHQHQHQHHSIHHKKQTNHSSSIHSSYPMIKKDIFDDVHEISCIESGVYFGIGLLSLIFSLLPPKVNKLLNTLGFYSSRPFALQLLQQSYRNKDSMFSSLSALALLAYYTNLSSFAHPQLLPSSFTLKKAREIVNEIKLKYPHGKIWKLLEGKLYRMEGNLTKSVQVLRDCRRRDSVCMSPLPPSSPTLPISVGGHGPSMNKNVKDYYQHISMTTTFPIQMQSPVSELAIQISALSVYEMGWGQIFLGDYFQASETFYRLESMNNWSRAFYHYIATCCLYGDEEYDKAAIDFIQIPRILSRRKKNGTRLLANEQFAERTIQQWIYQSHQLKKRKKMKKNHHDNEENNEKKEHGYSSSTTASYYYRDSMDGDSLQKVVMVHPLWEIIYLWNGMYHVSPNLLQQMKQELNQSIESLEFKLSKKKYPNQQDCSNIGRLYLLLGVVVRELGSHGGGNDGGNDSLVESCFKKVIRLEKHCFLEHQHDHHHDDDDLEENENENYNDEEDDDEDSPMLMSSHHFKKSLWAGPYAMYELALLRCLQVTSATTMNNKEDQDQQYSMKAKKIKEARDWLRKIDQYHYHYHTNNHHQNHQNHNSNHSSSSSSSINYSDVSCESTCMLLHVRCQLLLEKMDDLDY